MKTVDRERQTQLDRGIAYFMGWRIDNSYPDKGKVWTKGNGVELETTFKFSSDWNELVKVYEAVNELEEYCCRFYSGYCAVYERGYSETEEFEEQLMWQAPHKEPAIITKEAVYRCLGEFIEHYNELQIKKNAEQSA